MLGADPARLQEFGRQMRRRRTGSPPDGLGYRHMPAFTQDRGINARLAGDVEKGRRDTYTFPSLQDVARAYDVIYGSMIAVVWSGADELVPAGAAVRSLPAPDVTPADPPGWPPGRTAADKPFFDEINERRVELAFKGIAYPTGAEMFGEGTWEAAVWDTEGAPLSVGSKAWLVADMRRLAAGRAGNSGTGAASA